MTRGEETDVMKSSRRAGLVTVAALLASFIQLVIPAGPTGRRKG